MELRRRRFRRAVRLEVSDSISQDVLHRLLLELDLSRDALYRTSGPIDLGGLASIAGLPPQRSPLAAVARYHGTPL